MAEGPDGVELTDARGGAWRVDGVVASDARGELLPTRLVVHGEGLRVEVDDAGAVYPIEVDPDYTTAAVTWTGSSAERLGKALGGADVDGDGYIDVILGAPNYNSQQGRVYVYHGSSGGPSTTADTTNTGASAAVYFGYSVARAGDVNGDGIDDVIIGAPDFPSSMGRAYVYHGSTSGLTTATTALTVFGGYMGESVSGAGT